MAKTILEMKGISKSYGGIKALKDAFERDFNILKQKDDPNMSEERLYMARLPLNPGLPRVGTVAP